jgi:acyl carrier protein
MTTQQLEDALLAFVNGTLLAGKAPATPTDRLFEDGFIDSLRVLELIAFLESAIGRKVPDRQVRLATFRSVRAIALTFGGDGDARAPAGDDIGVRYRYHTDPSRFANPLSELRRLGALVEDDAGMVRLTGVAARLFTAFDDAFARWARELGADDIAAPATIATATLERAGFINSFPQLLLRAGGDLAYSPAACYHRYAALAGTALTAPVVLGVHARCRRVETAPRPLERATEFTMREVVVLGTSQDVERVRRRLLRRVDRFVTALALDGAIEPASDPFFTSDSAGRALAQSAGELKHELRLSLEGGRRIAAASFNRHHDHFGRAFDISFAQQPAHSGCIAFGVERWVLAFFTQHGLDERAWPSSIRDALERQVAHAAP